ncbi:MAG: hypothetical protein ACI3W8_00410 [Oscillospiraceae bacterium]
MPNDNGYSLYPNTPYVQPLVPFYVPAIPPDVLQYLAALEAEGRRLAVENERQRQQLQAKVLREEAYATAVTANQRTWTVTESNRLVELLNAALTSAVRVEPRGPEEHPAYYVLCFSGKGAPVVLDEPSYLDDRRLLHSLQIGGVGVTIRRSTRTTAALLRQCISEKLSTFYADYYAGWQLTEQGPAFLRFQAFSSHQTENFLELAHSAEEISPAASAVAAERLARTFQAIRAPALRWLLFGWFHAAFLFSLLESAGCALPLGLSLYVGEPALMDWLRQLFCWYEDEPINLDGRPAEFLRAMWSRKDQPAVVIDHHQTRNSSGNAALLEEILSTGKVPWKQGRRETVVPLRAPVVVLSDTISSLCCSPGLVTLDIQAADFGLESCRQYSEQPPVQQDYLLALASFTASHWPELQQALRRGRAQAMTLTGVEERALLSTAGTLLGAVDFAAAFFRFCGVESPFAPAEGEVAAEAIGELLSHAAANASGMDVAGQFCQLARRCLADGVFYVCDADRDDSDGEKPVVYRVRGDYGFPTEAFRLLCRRMTQSAPVIVRALAEAGLLQGKRTNATTAQTRIPVTGVHGVSRWLGVYRIAREDILGEI